jgi:hypothetical protein
VRRAGPPGIQIHNMILSGGIPTVTVHDKELVICPSHSNSESRFGVRVNHVHGESSTVTSHAMMTPSRTPGRRRPTVTVTGTHQAGRRPGNRVSDHPSHTLDSDRDRDIMLSSWTRTVTAGAGDRGMTQRRGQT